MIYTSFLLSLRKNYKFDFLKERIYIDHYKTEGALEENEEFLLDWCGKKLT